MKLKIFYDAASTIDLQPSLADMKAGRVPKPTTVIAAEPIVAGTGTPAIEQLDGQGNKIVIPPVAATPAAVVIPPVVADPPPAKTADELAAEALANVGKTPEQIAEEARLAAEPAMELTEEELIANFWKAVDDKSGKPVKVEYPIGVDPLSPDGVYIRDLAVREQAEIDFDAAIKANNPRGYAYMMHLQQGGTDEEWMGRGVGLALPERSVVESQVDTQTMIVKMDLKAKGVEDEYVTAIVDKAIKENKLKDMSLKAYDGILTDQRKQLAELERRDQIALQQERQLEVNFHTSVDKAITTMRFMVPDTEKAGFKAWVSENAQVQGGKIYMVQAIDAENIQQQLEAGYLLYKKGDLNKIVQKQATTVTAQRLRTALDKTTMGAPKSGEPAKPVVANVSLAEMWRNRAAKAAANK